MEALIEKALGAVASGADWQDRRQVQQAVVCCRIVGKYGYVE